MTTTATTSTASSVAANTTASQAATAKQSLAGDMNTFLKLLTTQLQHQDPLSPMDSSQFTSQLVQFASVEQQINTNSNLEKMLAGTNSSEMASAVTYLGTTVQGVSTSLPLQMGQASFTYTTPASTSKITATITDSAGNVVKTLTGGDEVAGRQLYGHIVNFRCFCKLVFLVNNVPKFSECGAEMLKRIRQLVSGVQFFLPTEYNTVLKAKQQSNPGQDADKLLSEVGIFRADEALSERCKNNSAALIWIVVNTPLSPDVNEITPESVKIASLEVVAERDEVKTLFDQSYERCVDGRASTKSIQQTLHIPMGGSGDRLLAARMKAWGFEPPRVLAFDGSNDEARGSRSGYLGLKRKRAERDDE